MSNNPLIDDAGNDSEITGKLPTVYSSMQKVKKNTPQAEKMLKRMDAMDLTDILGMSEFLEGNS